MPWREAQEIGQANDNFYLNYFGRKYQPNDYIKIQSDYSKGSSINDVTVPENCEGQRFCDDITRSLVIKTARDDGGGGTKNA